MAKITKIIPLNRVEGDLELQIELDDDNVVQEARSIGTMYRGIENLMSGRAPLDSLVITPRICGICTTAHLNAAAKALEDLGYFCVDNLPLPLLRRFIFDTFEFVQGETRIAVVEDRLSTRPAGE